MADFGQMEALWAQLSIQLHAYNSVIVIDEREFAMWGHAEQQFVLRSYM